MLKYFEVRDSMTFIPVVAFRPSAGAISQGMSDQVRRIVEHGLSRSGWSRGASSVIVCRLDRVSAHSDQFEWGNNSTLYTAHRFIADNWDDLVTGAVIDVEFILGEKSTVKVSEALV